MKYIKIFALALAAFSLTACSDSDDYNSASGVTVEMAQSEITVSESTGLFNVPLKVTGEANGPIKVRMKVEGVGNNPAKPFVESNGSWSGDYIVTSLDLNIPADTKTVAVEINTVDNTEENENKTLAVTIESVEGASTGSLTTTNVIIKDNDSFPYDKVQGSWKLTFNDYDGKPAAFNTVISGVEEGSAGYGEDLALSGILDPGAQLSLYFHYDEATGEAFVEMNLPEPIIWYDETHYIWVLKGMSLSPGVVRGTFSEDLKTITFNPEDMLVLYVASPDMSDQLGVYEKMSSMTMTRQ